MSKDMTKCAYQQEASSCLRTLTFARWAFCNTDGLLQNI